MHKSSKLWTVMAAGSALLWGSIAIAQSSGSPNTSPTRAATSPAKGSTVMSSLVCDYSGQICIAVGKREIGAAPAATSTPSAELRNVSGSVPVAAPSPIAAPEVQPSKQQAVATAPRSLICNASGKVCAPASTQPSAPSAELRNVPGSVRVAAPSPSPIAAPEVQPSKQQAVATAPPALICDASGKVCAPAPVSPVQPSAKTEASQPQVKGQAAQTRIDGMGAPEETAGLMSEDAFNWVVHAYKSQHRLEVYFRGHLFKTYHAVFGRNPEAGAKLWEGDRRTPEGNYLIVSKHRSARFGWFLHINYPNEQDHERFEEGRAEHMIPASAHEGGQIGIHGTDSPYLNVAEVDWTTGCISVDNTDIRELARLLPVGSLVIIEP
jgi:lipoprotein-anchoring transpeptidase ErfK/SrfK